jgi:hypothetical protein
VTKQVLKAHADAYGDFENGVNNLARELTRHALHMARVGDGVDPYPAPREHPLLHECVQRRPDGTWVPDYEIVDVIPCQPGELRQRKDALISLVGQAEHAAMRALLPVGKWRAHDIRWSELIVAGNIAGQKALLEINTINTKRIVDDQEPMPIDEIQAKINEAVQASYSSDDAVFLDQYNTFKKCIDAIVRHAARMSSDVEDLDETNLHLWKMEPFPT